MDYTLFADGAVTENPGGLGSWGWLLKRDGSHAWLARGFGCLPSAPDLTNNVCEYEALFQGLVWFLMHVGAGGGHLVVRLDAQLVAHQVAGRWQCRSPVLARSLAKTQHVLGLFDAPPAIEWIPRAENEEADRLCALARRGYRSRPVGSAYWFSECLRPAGQPGTWGDLVGSCQGLVNGSTPPSRRVKP